MRNHKNKDQMEYIESNERINKKEDKYLRAKEHVNEVKMFYSKLIRSILLIAFLAANGGVVVNHSGSCAASAKERICA